MNRHAEFPSFVDSHRLTNSGLSRLLLSLPMAQPIFADAARSSSKEMVVIPVAGLANRIIALACCMRAAEQLGRNIRLIWHLTPACDSRFADLFENYPGATEVKRLRRALKQFAQIGSGVQVYCGSPGPDAALADLGVPYTSQMHGPVTLNRDDQVRSVVVISHKWVVLEGESVGGTDGAVQQLPSFVRKLRPAAEISRRIDAFAAEHSVGHQMVGVHIRRTDKDEAMPRLGFRSSDDAFFIGEIRRRMADDPSLRFFLATDAEKTREAFQREFGQKLLVAPMREWVRRRDTSNANWLRNIYRPAHAVQDALVELLLLSKTGTLIGSRGSSFTHLAHIWGENRLVLENEREWGLDDADGPLI